MKPFATTDEDCLSILTGVMDVIRDGIAVFDHDFKVIWANRWLEDRYADKAPLVGKKCYEVFTDLTEPRADCPYVACLDTGEIVTDVFPYQSSEDTIRRFEMTLYRLEDSDGGVTGVVGHIKDMTDQRHAEEMLREEISRNRLLLHQSRDGIVVLDEEGGVFDTNLEFARMLGYSVDEVHALHVWDWESQHPKEAVQAMLRGVDEKGDHFESRHLRKDGTFYEVEISTNGATYLGKKYVFCVCRDITERKHRDEERESLIRRLQGAHAEIKALEGILPLCSYCKKIRVGVDAWEQVDVYIQKHSEAAVSHGICPECMKERYPDL